MKEVIFRLSDDWLNLDKVVLYGFGGMTRDNLSLIKHEYRIVCILDSNAEKCGNCYEGIEVRWINDCTHIIKENKILIMSSGYMADEISAELEKYGLSKYHDFCKFEEWIMETMYRKKGQLCLFEINTSVTSRCTLNCKNCNMFMPYFKNTIDYTIDDVIGNITAFFNHVDYVCKLTVLGGEPLLCGELPQMLLWIAQTYGNRIGKITLITNGTLIPTDDLLGVCETYRISISISDYTEEVNYKKRLDEVKGILDSHGIEYQVRKNIRWCDMGFPAYKYPVPTGGIREHMLNCGPVFHGLNDMKLYYCHCSWAANRSGLLRENDGDYVDLERVPSDEIRRDILNHCRGDVKKGFISLCAVCGGCGNDNQRLVKAAVQLERTKNEC